MARSHRTGVEGERLAAARLEATGWRILERNFRAGHREIDLVARRGAVIAFVEVKSRRGGEFGHPLEAITWRKRREIAAVARAWLASDAWRSAGEEESGEEERPAAPYRLRFDAVAVTFLPDAPPVVEHVEDAWRL